MKQTRQRIAAGWAAFGQAFDRRNLAERWLFCGLALALTWLLFDALWLGALQAALRTERTQISQAQSTLAELATQRQVAELLLGHDPDLSLKARQSQLNRDLVASEGRWAGSRLSLLGADQAIPLLADLLQRVPALEKLEWTMLPPQAAGPSLPPATSTANATSPATPTTASPVPVDGGSPLLWRQTVRLRVRGSYRDVAQYVRLLEDLPYRLRCEQVLLSANSDPTMPHRVTATLLISTLSFEERWLAF